MKLLKIFLCVFLLSSLVNCKFDGLNPFAKKGGEEKTDSILAKLLQQLSKNAEQT
ncbi:hypothetical protein QIA37_05220 (plasmid) [Borrelia sp. CA_690]|uniref:hypothetical protein n=1 Tax=Borrelia TaxID=138 RepID=UPI001E3C241B|nr:hypothetical protein [Borrelia maritima]